MTVDVLVIGSGPGGYVAAIRAAQLGFSTGIVEKNPTLGGTCLNVGCIPSKALLDSSEKFYQLQHSFADHGILVKEPTIDLKKMLSRKNQVVTKLTSGIAQLMKSNKIQVLSGLGVLTTDIADGNRKVIVKHSDGSSVNQEVFAKHIILATGSEPIELPGLEFDGNRVISSTEALELPEVPKRLLVIGAGAIGLEMASIWARLGSDVTVVELANQILPGWEPALAKGMQKELEKLGISFILSNKGTIKKKTKTKVTIELATPSPEKELHGDRVLVAVGRKPYSQGLGLDNLGINLDSRGRFITDSKFRVYQSDQSEDPIPGMYAIGDCISGPMLAHKAEDEGVALAEILAGQAGHVNYDVIPGVVYTWPEAAMVGKTEEGLKKASIPYKKGSFALGINGRALAMGESAGSVVILAHEQTDRILGAHVWGPWASDLIAEITAVMELKGTAEDLARTVHAHPTLPEAVKEAAMNVHGFSIHGVNRNR
jgi:dihydrolipoamide dehydrogenase